MSSADRLGPVHRADLTGGRISYRATGDGPPVVFVHGLLVNADLWRDVVPAVAEAGYRCIAPDWPLGSHTEPVPAMDLSPGGVARTIEEFLERLDLSDVTLVSNDTGGALTQILIASAPPRVSRVVFTPSDAFERFFPPMFGFLPILARVPGAPWLLAHALRLRGLHRLPMVYGWLTKRGLTAELAASFTDPCRQDPAVRADMARFLRGVHRRHTLAAATRLHHFTGPVLLAWANEDRLFPTSLASRIAERLPRATVVGIDDSYTFVPLDRPDRLAELVVEFAGASTP